MASRVAYLSPLAFGLLVSCGAGPAATPARVFSQSSAATGSSNASRSRPVVRLRRDAASPPAVDAAAECTPAMTAAIERFKVHGRAFHFGPVCSGLYTDEWVAIVATGTAREATDVWVLLGSGNEVHPRRVRQSPVGVHYTGATIAHGFGYLVGDSIAADEMPANASALVVFAVPHPREPDPVTLDLSAAEVGLLGVHDRAELASRIAATPSEADPSAAASEALVRRVLQNGTRELIGALPAGNAPLLRAWQRGVYERVSVLHPELDPSSARLSAAMEVIRTLDPTMDCFYGDRCMLPPRAAATESPDAAVPSQVIVRRGISNHVIAAIVEQGRRPAALANPSQEGIGSPLRDVAADRELVEALSLGSTAVGPVTGVMRGRTRVIMADVARDNVHGTSLFVVAPDRAPRRFDDVALGPHGTGSRELHVRDIEHNFEPEITSVLQVEGGEASIGVATLLWPPAIVDRSTYPRWDVMRALLGSHTIADADRTFRSYTPPQADEASTCAALESLTSQAPRALANATSGGMVLIDYQRPGEPLSGSVRRVPVAAIRRATDGNEILGPFVGARCGDLLCDWFQGYCRRTVEGRERGYLWLTGRRAAPLWGVSKLDGATAVQASGGAAP